MRSTGRFSLLLLLMLVAASSAQQISPHRDIRWPANCSGAGQVYNFLNNTCLNMNAIDPSQQLTWPSNCNSSNFMTYNLATNTCFSGAVQIAAGTTTTLPAGAAATVTQTGTFPNYTLNFGIPTGTPGGSLSYPGVITDNNNGLNVTGGVSSSKVTSNVNNTSNPVVYGAVGGCPMTGSSAGCHDDSGAFTQAQTMVFIGNNPTGQMQIPYPPTYGCYYIPSFVWLAVPMVGPQTSGNQKPVCLRGGPGIDVLHPLADAARMPNQNSWNQYWALQNLQLVVDDTVPCADSWNGNCAHRWPGVWFNDVTTTAGSAIITTTHAQITCGDTGQAILIRGAGAAGADLVTTIASVAPCWSVPQSLPLTSSWVIITLATPAGTSVTNATGYKSIFGLPVTATIGQAGIGFDMQSADSSTWTVPGIHLNASHVKLDNVSVSFVSGGNNNGAAAFYNQGWSFYHGTARNIVVTGGGVWGWVQACPEINYIGTGNALVPCGSDHQQFNDIAIQGPSYPWLLYGGSWGVLRGVKFTANHGIAFKLGPQAGPSWWTISIGEHEGSACVQGDIIEGTGHRFENNSFICGTTNANANIWLTGSYYTGTVIFNNSASPGGHVYIGGVNSDLTVEQVPSANAGWIQDLGFGNQLKFTGNGGYRGITSNAQVLVPTRGYNPTVGLSVPDFLRNGDYSSPYSLRDLWFWPTDFVYPRSNDPAGTTYSFIESDSTSPTGYTLKLTPGSGYSSFRQFLPFSTTDGLIVGKPDSSNLGQLAGQGGMLPVGKGTMTVLAKCDSGITNFTVTLTTQGLAPNVTMAFATFNTCTTSFQLFTAPYDASLALGGRVIMNGATNTSHIAWISLMPAPFQPADEWATAGNRTTAAINMPAANATALYSFVPQNAISAAKVTYRLSTADNTANLYDIGVYTTYSNGTTLLCHTGALAGTTFAPNATNPITVSFTGGSCNLYGGYRYTLALTTTCTSSCAVMYGAGNTWMGLAGVAPSSGGTTTLGVLNNAVTPPALSWTDANNFPWIDMHN